MKKTTKKCRILRVKRKICRNPENEWETSSGAYMGGILEDRVKYLKKLSDKVVEFRDFINEKEAEKLSKLLDIELFKVVSYLSELKMKLEDRVRLGII
jgi:hypothetical protein